ncbi:hypothetical protein MtrunA17_Chr8g0337311 [Medicago truncatula]|uniref:Transmembrane protein n=1 Tax=Medicago truncatula TaxID=3880 RepID=A0A396GAS9_MEDTR|nr:hypothetical protein MtrunA17_Chr8g0337311 [Medicago truncatula]
MTFTSFVSKFHQCFPIMFIDAISFSKFFPSSSPSFHVPLLLHFLFFLIQQFKMWHFYFFLNC